MEIAIDFDDTCVKHNYPDIKSDIGAISVLKQLVQEGHNLILYTIRFGKELDDAANWFLVNGIKLYGIQYNPTQTQWTSSNKCHAHLYIDDSALGCPLIYPDGERPYVDWENVLKMLKKNNYLK